jgi:hypothetical protein
VNAGAPKFNHLVAEAFVRAEVKFLRADSSKQMNALLEPQRSPGMKGMAGPDGTTHDLMQQHLRDENLPEAVMPACPINKVLKGQKAIVTGANSGIGKSVALAPRSRRRGCRGELRHSA